MFRWASYFTLVALASVRSAQAESALPLDLQEKTVQLVNLAATVERTVVDNPHVVLVFDRGGGAVEFHGRQPGEAMVLIWTEKARFIFLVSVKAAPPPMRPAVRVDLPRPTAGKSLHLYRGSISFASPDSAAPNKLQRHRHQVMSHTPIASGNVLAYATVDVAPEGPPILSDILFRYQDNMLRLDVGDLSLPAMALIGGISSVRGIAGLYDDGKYTLSAFGGTVRSVDGKTVFDPNGPQRLGAVAAVRLTPNFEVGVEALRRTQLAGANGVRDLHYGTFRTEWEPFRNLTLKGQAGVSTDGQAARLRLRYAVPLVDLSVVYQALGGNYRFPGSSRIEVGQATLSVRPSRYYLLLGRAGRSTEGAGIYEPAKATYRRDVVQAQLDITPGKLTSNFFQAAYQHATETPREVDAGSTTKEADEIILVANYLPSETIGRFGLHVTGSRSYFSNDPNERLTVDGSLNWSLDFSGGTNITVTAGYATIDSLVSTDEGIERSILHRVSLQQALQVSFRQLLGRAQVGFAREASPLIGTQDVLLASASLIFRPTPSHEIRGDIFVRNTLRATNAIESTIPASSSSAMLSYAIFFGDAVPGPTLVDYFTSSKIRVSAFLDTDENGKRDAGEEPLAGVTIWVDEQQSVTTDDDGQAIFDDLAPRIHRVSAELASLGPGYKFTTSSMQKVILETRDTQSVTFGVSDRARIHGRVFNDLNLDGSAQIGEDGRPHLRISLHVDGKELRETTTKSGGFFEFTSLSPGRYEVVLETLPSQYTVRGERRAQVVLGPSDIAMVTFPVAAIRTVFGYCYVDRNRNGRYDLDDIALEGIRIRFDGQSVPTNHLGKYFIRNLPPGPVSVWVDATSVPTGIDLSRKKKASFVISKEPASEQVDFVFLEMP